MDAHLVVRLVLLLAIANGAPLIARLLMGQRFNQPLDRNMKFVDGLPLLGPAKTLRGVVSALLASMLTAPLFDLSPGQGALFAAMAMAGDLASSFTKRRLGIASSRSAPLLDQLPESLLPLWVLHPILAETIEEAAIAVLVFVVMDSLRDRLGRDVADAG